MFVPVTRLTASTGYLRKRETPRHTLGAGSGQTKLR